MQSRVPKKFSEIILEMAESVLRDPRAEPSSEAAHLALLLAHIAWNRAVGHPPTDAQFRMVHDALVRSNPHLWDELEGRDVERIIERLMTLKRSRFPDDLRVIHVCGMRGANVHVEWSEGEDMRKAQRAKEEAMHRVIDLVMAGDDKKAVQHLCQTVRMPKSEALRIVRDLRTSMKSFKP